MRKLKWLSLFFAALMLIACGGGDSGTDAGVDAGQDAGTDAGTDGGGDEVNLPSLETWCATVSEAACDLLQRCSVPGQEADDRSECLQRQKNVCSGGLLPGMSEAGWISYSGEHAQACLHYLETVDCESFNHLGRSLSGSACDLAIEAQQSSGSPCVSGFECQSGVCLFTPACPGSCAPWAQAGGNCSDGQVCPDNSMCLAGTCQQLPSRQGDPCPQGMCVWPLMCQRELVDPDQWVCVPLALEGESCGGAEGACFPGLFCKKESGQTLGLCQALGREGDACSETAECWQDTGLRLLCSGGTCLPAPGAGEPCEDYLCDQAWCDTQAETPTCRALGGLGDSCEYNGQCQAQFRCLDGSCQDWLALGEDCGEEPYGCGNGLQCKASTCVPAGAPACDME